MIERFKAELLQFVIDRVNDGCNKNIAFLHAASRANGAADLARLLGQDDWQAYQALAQEFWDQCFPEDKVKEQRIYPSP